MAIETSAVNQTDAINKLKRVKERVKAIKSWYWSIPTYIVGTAMMLFLTFFIDPPFWMKLVLLIGPVLWWVFLIVQGINLFLPKTSLMKNWEERQIKKYLKA